MVSADAWAGDVARFEAEWDSANKVETGDGWSLRGAADARFGFITLGGAYTHRETSAWSKDVWWARGGVQSGPIWLLASIAPASANMEAKVEARLRFQRGHAIVEPRLWVGRHSTSAELGGYAYGAEILAGFGGHR